MFLRLQRVFLFLGFLSLVHCGHDFNDKSFSPSSESVEESQSLSLQSLEVSFENAAETCDSSSLSCQVFTKVNQVRTRYGLTKLKLDRACQNAAQSHAQDMALYQYLQHQGRDGSTPKDRLQSYGSAGFAVAENIGRSAADADQIVAAWMDSPGHRANILDPDFTHTGVGAASSQGNLTGYGQDYYYAQCFTMRAR